MISTLVASANQTELTRLVQTRVNGPTQTGNCFATVIACLMGLDDPEAVFQVQEHYHRDKPGDPHNWVFQLDNWLKEAGYRWLLLDDHLFDNRFYMVIGQSPRQFTHVCIYQNGQLVHDPHPEGGGLLTEERFELLEPIES